MPNGLSGAQYPPMANGQPPIANPVLASVKQQLQNNEPGMGVPMVKTASVSNLAQMTTLSGYPSMPQLNALDGSPNNSSNDLLNVGMMHMVGQFQAFTLGNNPPPTVPLMQAPPDPNLLTRPVRGPWLDSTSTASHSPLSNAASEFKRSTLNVIPNTQALLNKSKIPLALILTPYRLQALHEEPVPLVNPEEIVRCRKCRTYINPFVVFVDNGMRWKCNICFLTNDLPSSYDFDMVTRQPVNRFERPELTHAVIEMVASSDYMVRPPQPVIMVFILDVSYHAVQSGALRVACQILADALDELPMSAGRTQVALIAVDRNLHFFSMPSDPLDAQHFIVPDLSEPYLPIPADLLVHLNEFKDQFRSWLDRIPEWFAGTRDTDNALGPALLAACKLVASIGGKLVIIQSSLPSVGKGALKYRGQTGNVKESELLLPADKFYKDLTVECSRNQIGIDLFLLGHTYCDIATLSAGPKYTGGSLFNYPNFNGSCPEDCEKFGQEFTHFLASPLGLEAVLRIRATNGIKINAYHGNFFLRSTDLLALAHVTADNAYAVEMSIQENLTSNIAIFQTALLHTSSVGERRIRIVTLAVPVSNNLADVVCSMDSEAVAALLTKKAVERVLTSSLEDARDAVINKLVEMLSSFKTQFLTNQQSVNLPVPKNWHILPLLVLGLMKSMALRPQLVLTQAAGGNSNGNVLSASAHHCAPVDWRSYLLALLYACPAEMIGAILHPRFYQLDTMQEETGLPHPETGEIQLPPLLNLTSEKLVSTGLFLLDNGLDLYLYVGRQLSPELFTSLFKVSAWDDLPSGKSSALNAEPDNDFFLRVSNIVAQIRTTRLRLFTQMPYLYIIKENMEDAALRSRFLDNLIEDRNLGLSSYFQFLNSIREQVSKS